MGNRKKDIAVEEQDQEEFTLEDQLEMQAVGLLPNGDEETEQQNGKPEKIYRNNKDALMQKYQEMKLSNIAGGKIPWIETLDITSDKPLQLPEADIHNDLARELAFYQQALHAAKEAKSRILQAKVPFDRPEDYFAEMIKSDEHMEKIRKRLVEEAESIKKSEEAKKMRDMRKFGKQVQIQKLQERSKAKADTLKKINELKKKRKNNPSEGLDDDDEFDIALDDGADDKKSKKTLSKKVNHKRLKKDEKFGFGGKKKHAKSNTTESTDDFSFNSRKNKKGFPGVKYPKNSIKKQMPKKRLGKSQRKKTRS